MAGHHRGVVRVEGEELFGELLAGVGIRVGGTTVELGEEGLDVVGDGLPSCGGEDVPVVP